MAWQNFKRNPEVLIARLMRAAYSFLCNLPDQLFRGYGKAILEPSASIRGFISLVSVVGLIFVFLKRRERGELVFWTLFWLSVVASSSFIYFDDGDRALAVSYVFIFFFFAFGFASPSAAPGSFSEAQRRRLNLNGISCFAIVALLFFSIPWLAYRLWPGRQLVISQPLSNAAEAVVFGGRRMSGFLVVPDGIALRKDVATVDFSTFSEIVKQSGIEQYQGLVNPRAPKTPFGFVYAPRLDSKRSNYQYIVPSDVIERRDVRAWRFELKEWQRKPSFGPYWFYVTRAEPVR